MALANRITPGVVGLPRYVPPGHIVCFEGLDGTGKSTQLERFERSTYAPDAGHLPLLDPKPYFTHQPSGATGLGQTIYELVEGIDWRENSSLTRAMLNMASHTEHYRRDIIPYLEQGQVWMDRCWWSTFAYNYRNEVAESMTPVEWIKVAQLPTQGHLPDVVFLFTERYGEDDVKAGSDDTTLENYEYLMNRYPDIGVRVPRGNVGEVTAFIAGELSVRGLWGDR